MTRLRRYSTPWMELYALAVAAATWGRSWAGKQIEFLCDNETAVVASQNLSARHPAMAELLRTLLFTAASSGFHFRLRHIRSEENSAADLLSRLQTHTFLRLHPAADRSPTRPSLLPTHSW